MEREEKVIQISKPSELVYVGLRIYGNPEQATLTLLDDLRLRGFRLSIDYTSRPHDLLMVLERADSLLPQPGSFPLIIQDLIERFPRTWDMDSEEGGEKLVDREYLQSIRDFGAY
ncbi:hypothetical protein ACIGJO_35545 [Streptomyces sp. NPDC079020]|uniref:hypothetical protein n=1 Tax=Streptomyces sp. NPDC079020 TaxID=3365722 RepID=UPI0037D5C585